MSEKRIAWAITGAGHTLEECIDVLLNYDRVDLFLSRAAEEVLSMYNLEDRVQVPKIRIYQETKSSSPQVIRLFGGTYNVLVIAPAYFKFGCEICVRDFGYSGNQPVRPGGQVTDSGYCLPDRSGAYSGYCQSTRQALQSLSASDRS